MVKKGNDAINQVHATLSRILNSTAKGRKFLIKNPHIDQKLAYHICKDLGLICGYTDGKNWLYGCRKSPRARGLCMKHFQRKYIKYIKDIPDDDDGKGKEDDKKIKKRKKEE